MRLELAVVDVDLSHRKHDAHRVRAAVERSRHKRCTLTQCRLKLVKHATIAWWLDHVSKRSGAVTENVRNDDHVVSIAIDCRVRTSIRNRERRQCAAGI